MKKTRYHILYVTLIYLVATLGNIFFLPQITSAGTRTRTYNSLHKRKIEHASAVNCLERGAKAAFFKDPSKNLSTDLPLVYLDYTYSSYEVSGAKLATFISNSRSYNNQRYSYLSLKVFRI